MRGLRVDYGHGPDAVHAVDGADLTLHRGEVLGLAGESGSGKSTLVFAVTRLLRAPGRHHRRRGDAATPGAGRPPVDMLGAGDDELRVLRWSEISLVMQSAMNALNPVMTIRAQLTDVLAAHVPEMAAGAPGTGRGAAGDGRHQRRPAPRYPHELSGGMRQRVMIAMALALRPQIVIMDEPTTALDVVTQREILEELKELRDQFGFAILFITHDLSLLIEIADSIAVMYAGRLVERAARTRCSAPRGTPTRSGCSARSRRCTGRGCNDRHPRLAAGPARAAAGCVFHPRCKFAIDKCRTEAPRFRGGGGGRLGRLLAAARARRPCPPSSARPPAGPAAPGSRDRSHDEARAGQPRRHRRRRCWRRAAAPSTSAEDGAAAAAWTRSTPAPGAGSRRTR